MVINTFMLNARHPMRYLPRNNKIYIAQDGVTEIEGPGYEDTRPFIVTLLDPFDVVGMMKGRNMQQRFWETHAEGRLQVETGESSEVVESGRKEKSQVSA